MSDLKLNIHVVGAGVVGWATGEGFRRFGHDVAYSDLGDSPGCVEADLHFICTPEAAALDAIADLWVQDREARNVVIRSSVPPGTTVKASQRFPMGTFCHNPEFLREAVAEHDFLHATRAVIGWPYPYRANHTALTGLYEQMGVPVHQCSSTVSEMVKLLTNSYLATQLSFWDQAKALCAAAGVNSHQVGALVGMDPRVSPYGPRMHGTLYAHTKCLPKDLQQLIDFGVAQGTDVTLLEAVKAVDWSLAPEEAD